MAENRERPNLVPFLPHLMAHCNRSTPEGREKLANDPLTIAFLEAGLRLTINGLGVGRRPASSTG